MSFALEPPDLKNTIKSTFSPSFDSFLILYDIQDDSVSQKSEKNCLESESKRGQWFIMTSSFLKNDR